MELGATDFRFNHFQSKYSTTATVNEDNKGWELDNALGRCYERDSQTQSYSEDDY